MQPTYPTRILPESFRLSPKQVRLLLARLQDGSLVIVPDDTRIPLLDLHPALKTALPEEAFE